MFTYEGHRLEAIHNSAWKKAWKRAGLPTGREFRRGVHNLRHTFARRLRAAGVPHETCRVLMRHKNGDMTAHYAVHEVEALRGYVEKLVTMRHTGRTILRVVA